MRTLSRVYGWLGWVALVLIILSLQRFSFLVYNWDFFRPLTVAEVVRAFVTGLRFDLSAVLWLGLPLLLLVLFHPTGKGAWWRILRLLFLFVAGAFLVANWADLELYSFMGKRLTWEFFLLSKDWGRQGGQVAGHYWPLIGASFFTLVLVIWTGLRMVNVKDARGGGPLKGLALSVLLLPLVVLGLRGGWQLKPIHSAQAYYHPNPHVGSLVLNTPFFLLSSKSAGALAARKDFSEWQQVVDLLRDSGGVEEKWPQTQSVMVIVLESFSLEYLGVIPESPSYTPFLNELANDSRSQFLTSHFANGRRSIESVPSLFAGIPSLMDDPFITSRYQANQVMGLARLFAQAGYSTHFFHGADNGSMFFDTFSERLGFQNYHGLNEYPREQRTSDHDGSWGIFDGPFFQFTKEKLDETKKPFFSVLFSLSSHQPFSVPSELRGRFPQGTQPIHASIAYADQSLREFFEAAKKSDWYNQTLFVITADHTHRNENPDFSEPLGLYRVPLILFHPARKVPEVGRQRVIQHADFSPSMVDLFGLSRENPFLMGRSYWSKEPGRAIVKVGPRYWRVSEGLWVDWLGEGAMTARELDGGVGMRALGEKIVPQLFDQDLRAYVQYYQNGLLNDNWVIHPAHARQER